MQVRFDNAQVHDCYQKSSRFVKAKFFFRQSNKTNSILQDEKVIDYYQLDRSKKLEQIVHNSKGIERSPLPNKPTDDGRG